MAIKEVKLPEFDAMMEHQQEWLSDQVMGLRGNGVADNRMSYACRSIGIQAELYVDGEVHYRHRLGIGRDGKMYEQTTPKEAAPKPWGGENKFEAGTLQGLL